MVMARAVERRLWVMRRMNLADAPAALRIAGSEGVQVAAAAVLRQGNDWVVPYHRDLALCLAMGATPLDVMLALLGRAEDPTSGGRLAAPFGSSHARILTTSGVIGAQVPHAAGIAYASRLRELDEVTLVSIGERGTDTGDWHEGLNFAAVHRLPLICLVQDNSVPAGAPTPIDADLLISRAEGLGMLGQRVDGADFEAALDVLGRAVERARAGEGPTLVHARVPELTSLAPDGSFLARERLEAMAYSDPIERMRLRLIHDRVLDDASDLQVQLDCTGVVEAALEQALESPLPEPAAALENVWGG
jgi:2-oxoisovalerate dehydrogenase E1 component alpha subunit